MNACSCMHLMTYKSTIGVEALEIIHAYFVSCITEQARKEKARCTCHTCNDFGLGLHACISCVYIGCYVHKHIHEHADTENHHLAIDLSHGSLYCFACEDNIYDKDLEAIAKRFKIRSFKSLGIKPPYIPWEPDNIEMGLLKKNRKRIRISHNSYVGLRGLLNLGKTCFINCVVQALMHTPLLRDYFLADLHICQFSGGQSKCLACEMSRLFQEFYSGKSIPLVPDHLLCLVWTNARHIAGYAQQDAQEFFMAVLETLHRHCKGTNGLSSSNPNHCSCIIDKIFTGEYQSDIICQSCKKLSPKTEPFRDISLDVVSTDGESELKTLIDCLRRYTRLEYLKKSVKCDSCQCIQDSTKQLRMAKLPVVTTFHLKRFEQNSYNRRKITTYVSFPQYIDMAPFTSSYEEDNCIVTTSNNIYTLFAVVNHVGNDIESGHYTSYIRQHKDKWFKCDDDLITQASVDEVLQSQGYLLFYHKHILEYE